jgi:hypothetical protein
MAQQHLILRFISQSSRVDMDQMSEKGSVRRNLSGRNSACSDKTPRSSDHSNQMIKDHDGNILKELKRRGMCIQDEFIDKILEPPLQAKPRRSSLDKKTRRNNFH